MPKAVTRSQIERVAVRAALRGAKVHLRYYETGLTARFKGEVDLVTRADVESQTAIVGTLEKAFPAHEILAEEGNLGHNRPLNGPIWVVDPLDGTTNFAHGFPVFGVSVAYREGGETQFGLVYHPLLKEMYLAHRGRGSTLNGRPIRVSSVGTLSHALVATGFPYDRRTSPDNNLNYFCWFEMAAQCVRRAGAAAIDLAHLARGRLDGFWEPGLAPWDIAAGILLVEEAGGRCSDYSGSPLTDLWCGRIVASNGMIHDRMFEAMERAQKISIPNYAAARA